MNRIFLCVVALAFTACAARQEGPKVDGEAAPPQCATAADIEALRAEQKAMSEKLDKLIAAVEEPVPPPYQGPKGPDAETKYAIAVGDSPVLGKADAWVTVVEISDFQCPFCGRVQGTLAEIRKAYGDDVRFVFKHNPLSFHTAAMPSAIAAACAHRQGKFWPFHDKLFENQRELESKDIEKYAKASRLDMRAWKACTADGKVREAIEAEQRAMVAMGARGTPAFFINGRFLSGAQPYEAFKAVIDEALADAKASGVAKGSYYATEIEEKGAKKL